MSGNIKLHPTRGVNSFITVCERCGEDIGIALPGADDGIWICLKGHRSIGRPDHGVCCFPECRLDMKLERRLVEGEKLPGGICDKCEAEIKEWREEVEAGGLYFRCAQCHTEGVIRRESEYAIALRLELKKPAPEVFGIEIHSCPNCPKPPEASPTQE